MTNEKSFNEEFYNLIDKIRNDMVNFSIKHDLSIPEIILQISVRIVALSITGSILIKGEIDSNYINEVLDRFNSLIIETIDSFFIKENDRSINKMLN